MSESMQYCSFHVADHFFAIPVCDVQEVIRPQPMTRVPLSPKDVAGLINLRGQIVTAIDLRRRFNLDPVDGDSHPMNVVVRHEDYLFSLLVDTIGDVINADSESFESVPETLVGVARDLVSGVYKLKDRLLLILDVGKTIQLG